MGQTTAGTLLAGSVVDSDIAEGANIANTKVRHQEIVHSDFIRKSSEAPVATRVPVFVARGLATLRDFAVLLIDTGTATNVNFDLLVNGASVLTGLVNVVHGTGDRVPVTGTIATATLSVGDVVELDLAVTSATGATGPFAQLVIDRYYV